MNENYVNPVIRQYIALGNAHFNLTHFLKLKKKFNLNFFFILFINFYFYKWISSLLDEAGVAFTPFHARRFFFQMRVLGFVTLSDLILIETLETADVVKITLSNPRSWLSGFLILAYRPFKKVDSIFLFFIKLSLSFHFFKE